MKQFLFTPKPDMTPAEMAEIWLLISSRMLPVIIDKDSIEKSTAMRHFKPIDVAPPKEQKPVMKPKKR